MLKNFAAFSSWGILYDDRLDDGCRPRHDESHFQHGQGLLLALIVSIRSNAPIAVHLPQQSGSLSGAHRHKWLLGVGGEPGGLTPVRLSPL